MNLRIFILLACVCLIGSNGLILSPVLTAIAEDLNSDISIVSRSIVGYGLGTALSGLLLGRYIERIGYLKVLVSAMLLAGTAQLISGFSSSWVWLSVTQIFAGISAGVALPTIYALTSEISEKGKEAKTLGIVVFGWSVALIASIPIGTFLAHHFGWRTMLVVLGILFFIVTFFLSIFKGISSPKTINQQSKLLKPLTFDGAPTIYSICGLFMAAFYGTYSFTGAQAVEGFSQSIAQAGYVGLFYGLGFGIGSINSSIIDKIGKKIVFPLSLFIGCLVLLTAIQTISYMGFLATMFLIGILNSFIVNLIVLGVGSLNSEAKGASLGIYTAISYTGVSVGTLMCGQLYDTYGFDSIAYTASAFYFLAAILAVTFSRHRN